MDDLVRHEGLEKKLQVQPDSAMNFDTVGKYKPPAAIARRLRLRAFFMVHEWSTSSKRRGTRILKVAGVDSVADAGPIWLLDQRLEVELRT
ncbi:MAG: hypothetical protein Q8L22_19975, partial [Reyranella sp.]|nr:hypothetical protein [Reyranella sp.]